MVQERHINQDEKRELETQLIVMGLKSLDDPGLIEQLGKMVTDHEFLMGLINECDQDQRVAMYESIRPHLKFKPWPLDKYEAALARHASQIASYQEPISVGDEKFQRVAPDDATGALITFTCHKCTRTQQFLDDTPVAAVIKGREAGWVRDMIKQKEICPKCPAIREHVRVNNA